MPEAAVTHTEKTLFKVRKVLRQFGCPESMCTDIVFRMLNEGILFRERVEEPKFDFSNLTLEEAVFQALGAASMCWENMEGGGIFESDKAKVIGEALMARIRQAQPIHD